VATLRTAIHLLLTCYYFVRYEQEHNATDGCIRTVFGNCIFRESAMTRRVVSQRAGQCCLVTVKLPHNTSRRRLSLCVCVCVQSVSSTTTSLWTDRRHHLTPQLHSRAPSQSSSLESRLRTRNISCVNSNRIICVLCVDAAACVM